MMKWFKTWRINRLKRRIAAKKARVDILRQLVEQTSEALGSVSSIPIYHIAEACAEIAAMQEHLEQLWKGSLHKENESLEASFELRYRADIRAIKRWQEATGRKLVLPDHADLCVWLLGLTDETKEALIRLLDGFNEAGVAKARADFARDILSKLP